MNMGSGMSADLRSCPRLLNPILGPRQPDTQAHKANAIQRSDENIVALHVHFVHWEGTGLTTGRPLHALRPKTEKPSSAQGTPGLGVPRDK